MKKRYNSAFKLTEKGKIISEKIAKKIDSVLDFVSNGVTEDERKNMYKSLKIISDNLDKYCDKYEGEK